MIIPKRRTQDYMIYDGGIKNFIVLGAGLAGTMMARVLADHHPDKTVLVLDQRPSPDDRNHWALLRFRDLETARALGVAVREIEVEKAVYWRGQLHYTPNIAMNNQYSLKAYGHIGHRSLRHLGTAKRYLPLATPRPSQCKWGQTIELVDRDDDFTFIGTRHIETGKVEGICGRTIISTIPMQQLLQATAGLSDQPFYLLSEPPRSEPITVLRVKLKPHIRCDVNQTIYFPESRFWTYRATLESNTLICECIGDDEDHSMLQEMDEVASAFGLSWTTSTFEPVDPAADIHVQRHGKIIELDDDQRREVIYQLTDQYNVYSLGRFATWRPLRADQLVQDVYKVERMIRAGVSRSRYDRRLNCGGDQ